MLLRCNLNFVEASCSRTSRPTDFPLKLLDIGASDSTLCLAADCLADLTLSDAACGRLEIA